MPKQKTHRGAAKRFNLTKRGLVKRAKAYKRHILNKKTQDQAQPAPRRVCLRELRRHRQEAHPVQVSTSQQGGSINHGKNQSGSQCP